MPLTTVGIEHHHEKRVPARVVDLSGAAPDVAAPTRFKLLLLRSGSGVLTEGEAAEVLVSPAVALVGGQGSARVALDASARGLMLLFHPQYLNDELTFEALADFPRLSRTGREDRFLIRRFLDAQGPRGRVAQLEALAAQRLAGFFEQLREQLDRQPDAFWPCRSRSYFIQILLILDQLFTARDSAPPDVPRAQVIPWASASTSDHALKPIVAHLVAHCHEELSVDGLARAFATNRTTLQARFKKGTGMSVGQYVIRLRIQIAALLLRDTSLTVSEIMERTGFNDPSHFARMFKRHTGRSPSDFRALFRVPGYIVA
jgi:AraC-like DNA-binding protein